MIPKKFNRLTNTIFVDLDGVIVDFDKFVIDKMGRTFSHSRGPDGDRDMWNFLITVDHLYLNLQPTEYAFRLMDEIFRLGTNVEFLTAIPSRSKMMTAEQDKQEWISKYFGNHIKVNFGPFSKDKWKHCKKSDILIDDRIDNITDWQTKSEGFGILHNYHDHHSTINKLMEIVDV